MPEVTSKEYTHNNLGDAFLDSLSLYDTQQRVETLIDRFLTNDRLAGKTVLDVGCGLGFFSERLAERGADVASCDIGPDLVERTRKRVGCQCEGVDALKLSDHYGEARFDIVVSSECIEHTRDPAKAITEMAKVLKPGGYLSISTPNLIWYPAVWLATKLRLRPFDGHEHFSTWSGMRKALAANNIEVISERGLHLLPFQLPIHKLLHFCDQHLQSLRGGMVNICMLGQKHE